MDKTLFNYYSSNIADLYNEGNIKFIQPTSTHLNTVVWLHGFGDTHLGFYEQFSGYNISKDNKTQDLFDDDCIQPMIEDLPRKVKNSREMNVQNIFGENTKIVLPCAPLILTTALPAYRMNSWYDIYNLNAQDVPAGASMSDLKLATAFIVKIIEYEANLMKGDYQRIFLGGFCQGYTVALKAGLESEKKIGGVFGFCGVNLGIVDKHSIELPIFIGLSEQDSVISIQLARLSFERLIEGREKQQNKLIELKNTSSMKENKMNYQLYIEQKEGHTISQEGYQAIKEFFQAIKNN